MKYPLLDNDLVKKLEDPEERKRWLVLEPHEEFRGQWHVESFDSDFFFNLGEVVGPYRSIAPNKLPSFSEAAEECGYKLAFLETPLALTDHYLHLNDVPSVKINSPFENTVNGFLPFQVQGFNTLKDLDAGVVTWSTGTGKTVVASALLKYHWDQNTFDTAFFVVKGHNRINTQRTIKRLVGIDSVIIDGNKKKRQQLYQELKESHERSVIVLNYEKFRVDFDELVEFFVDSKILNIWDEMPTKLKNRNTQVYHAICNCLYDTPPPRADWEKRRPSSLRQYMLSATPIEQSPEDWFNCVRLLDPRIYGTVQKFRNEYVSSYSPFDRNKPEGWKNLDKMGLKASHIVHQVDKNNPDIAQIFPKVVSEPYFVDWDKNDRILYDTMVDYAQRNIKSLGPLAATTVLQMFCCAPTMLLNSANVYDVYENAVEIWMQEGGKEPPKKGSQAAQVMIQMIRPFITDARHTKFDVLRSLIKEVHPNEKICVYSSFNNALLPIIEKNFKEWGVTYVRYNGTPKQRQAAEDRFKSDPGIQVFLSSDAGSDSINLECGSVVIHYDLPWNWSTYIQRENRIHRVTSVFDTVRFYTLLMANSVEDRRLERVVDKMGYHEGVFLGAIADRAISSRMTKEDLMYICGMPEGEIIIPKIGFARH